MKSKNIIYKFASSFVHAVYVLPASETKQYEDEKLIDYTVRETRSITQCICEGRRISIVKS